ncbi:MAG: hypothetical protein IAE67_10920 [Candidatus Competibacteraceae bacterium]|nr:hypothetical protein [Candidatus Competibacteraceae bacterium]
MKNAWKLFALLGLSMIVFNSCDNEDECFKIWQVAPGASGVIVEIDLTNKELSMQGLDFGGFGAEIFQSYFTGDFEAIATFKNFAAGSGGGRPYAEMVMYNPEIPDTILDTTAVFAGITRNQIFSGIGVNWYSAKNTLGNNGVFKIKKFGNNLSSTVIVGVDTATVSQYYSVSPIRFGFRIGTFNDSIVQGISGIKFTKFQVIGSNNATLLGDEFICNSIMP